MSIVPSSSQDSYNLNTVQTTNKLKDLICRKKSLESEGDVIVKELITQPEEGIPPMGVNTPLIDSEGYPRADIDIYRARLLRKRFAEIKTDLKQITKQIEQGLADISSPDSTENEKAEMASRREPKPKPKFDPITKKWVVKNWDGTMAGVQGGENRNFDNLTSQPLLALEEVSSLSLSDQNAVQIRPQNDVQNRRPEELPQPFAVIDEVNPNSPAQSAGLIKGDLIVKFGSLDYSNHRNLQALAKAVADAAAKQSGIPVTLLRPSNEATRNSMCRNSKVTISIYPKIWDGHGMLGCHIQKMSE